MIDVKGNGVDLYLERGQRRISPFVLSIAHCGCLVAWGHCILSSNESLVVIRAHIGHQFSILGSLLEVFTTRQSDFLGIQIKYVC